MDEARQTLPDDSHNNYSCDKKESRFRTRPKRRLHLTAATLVEYNYTEVVLLLIMKSENEAGKLLVKNEERFLSKHTIHLWKEIKV